MAAQPRGCQKQIVIILKSSLNASFCSTSYLALQSTDLRCSASFPRADTALRRCKSMEIMEINGNQIHSGETSN